jgi:hypothetical protein
MVATWNSRAARSKFERIPTQITVSKRHVADGCDMAACSLGWERIDCAIVYLDETGRRLWEIAENLHRAELTALERSDHQAEWIRLTEAKEPLIEGVSSQFGTKLSARGRSGEGRPESGVTAAVRELGIKRTEAHRAIRRAENIAPDVKDRIQADLPKVADSGVELDALTAMPADEQREAGRTSLHQILRLTSAQSAQ